MRKLALCAALGLMAWGTTAVQARDTTRPETYTICLDQRGGTRPAICRSVTPGRLSNDQGICLCDGPDRPVEAPLCARGERGPGQSRAFEQARRDASQDGSLVGDTFEGRAMCVVARTDRR